MTSSPNNPGSHSENETWATEGREGGGAGMRDASGDLGIYAHELGNSNEEEEVEKRRFRSFPHRPKISFRQRRFPTDDATSIAIPFAAAAEVTWNTSFPFWHGGPDGWESEVYGEI